MSAPPPPQKNYLFQVCFGKSQFIQNYYKRWSQSAVCPWPNSALRNGNQARHTCDLIKLLVISRNSVCLIWHTSLDILVTHWIFIRMQHKVWGKMSSKFDIFVRHSHILSPCQNVRQWKDCFARTLWNFIGHVPVRPANFAFSVICWYDMDFSKSEDPVSNTKWTTIGGYVGPKPEVTSRSEAKALIKSRSWSRSLEFLKALSWSRSQSFSFWRARSWSRSPGASHCLDLKFPAIINTPVYPWLLALRWNSCKINRQTWFENEICRVFKVLKQQN